MVSLQCQHPDGQRRHARLLGRTGGTPRSAQVPRARGRRFAVRPRQGWHGSCSCGRPDGMSPLFEMDGKNESAGPLDEKSSKAQR